MSTLSKNEKDELACVYAGLLLFDDKVKITAEAIQKVLTASGNTSVESYYPEFFAKFMQGADLNSFLNNVGGGSAGGAPVAQAAVAEEKPKEEKGKEGDVKKGAPKGGDDKKGGKDNKKEPPKKEPEPEPEGEEGGFGDLFG